ALPEPELKRQLEAAATPPRSELEHAIAGIWRELLGVEEVGVHDSFFDLGGHSLLLVQLHQRLQEELGADLTMVELFEFPTIAGWAQGSASLDDARSRRGARAADEDAVGIIGWAGRFPGGDSVDAL